MNLEVVILAAGLGRRMYSSLPKVLHLLAGKPLLAHVVDAALSLNPHAIHVVCGHQSDRVKDALGEYDLNWIYQEEQSGTGHALAQALPAVGADSQVLVLYGDIPLISEESLKNFYTQTSVDELGLLLDNAANPFGLGRIIRDVNHEIVAIIEERDADPNQRQIQEIFSGILLVSQQKLSHWLPVLSRDNSQQEYYLTEIVNFAVKEQFKISSMLVKDSCEVQGVNNKLQLNQLERIYQERQACELLRKGVSICDSKRIDIRGNLECGKDVTLDVNVVFVGENKLGNNVSIGPNCYFENVTIGDNVNIFANSVIEDALIDSECRIGPFARIRPGTHLKSKAQVGNFVEIKQSILGEKSKVNHLSYIGDALIGEDVNVGAGVITCNYDGANKSQTIIEDGAFIGSGSQLVAPITVGKKATIGAGTTLRDSAPAEQLTLSSSSQKTIKDWRRPTKS